jgi:RHS repeat-associated protein
MTRNLHVFFGLSILVAVATSFSVAQVQTGTPPFGTFGGGPEALNLANLNASFTIPVLHKPGRGGLDFVHDLTYDTSVWYPQYDGNSVLRWYPTNNMGWGDIAQSIAGVLTRDLVSSSVQCGTGKGVLKREWKNWKYRDRFGTVHSFAGEAVNTKACNIDDPPDIEDLDATADGYSLHVSGSNGSASVTSATGIRYVPPIGSGGSSPVFVTDLNGNQITINNGSVFIDTTGNTVLTSAANPNDENDLMLTYTAPSGAQATYHVIYKPYTIKTNFGCSGVAEYDSTNVPQGVPAYSVLVDKIMLPDGNSYQFTYEPSVEGAVTGRLASVALPTGGSISYTYTGGNNGIICSDGSAAGLTRVVNDAKQSSTWTYQRATGSGLASTTTITDPLQNQSVLNFSGIYLNQRQDYNGSATGAPVRTIATCQYDSNNVCGAPSGPGGKLEVTTTVGSATSKKVLTYDSNFNVTWEDDYDCGVGAPGSLLRTTIIFYDSLGRPTLKIVKDGSGNVVSTTGYGYDEQAPIPTQSPQHVDALFGMRENLTSISYAGQGLAAPLNKSFTYYDTGNVATATDFNGAVTTYGYDGTCGNAYPTSVSQTLGSLTLSSSMVWDCVGGVMTKSTDANNNPTTYSYTNQYFWRLDASTDAALNTTNYSYTSNTIESTLNINGGSSTFDALTTVDGLGRTLFAQIKQGPGSSSFDTVATTYDSLGRVQFVSRPYSASSGQFNATAPGTTTQYDALSRPLSVTDSAGGGTTYSFSPNYPNDVLVTLGTASTNEAANQRQLEYDGLGRLKSVCELTSAPGSGICGQNSPATGYWTKYAYDALGNLTGVTQNAQSTSAIQSRSYTYDAVGRLTSESNPETGAIAYTYDSDTGCGTFKGDLVKRVDAAGNTVCYSYDALHRATAVTYSGQYAASTPNKYFIYDSATANGTSLSNTRGHLAEAYTGSSTNKITDVALGYSPRGEVTDAYESTPHSGGMYHVTASYWANGQVNQIGGLPQLPTFTYGIEGEGRVNTVSASSGQNPVLSTSYNAASQATGITFGSYDQDLFNFDPKRGSLCQYQTKINGRTAAGTFQWSKNGNLKTANFIDPFNWQQNQQNCDYSYDEMGRLKNADCGTVWGQSFTYDPFGNISKDRLPSADFGVRTQASYDNNNRIQSYTSQDPFTTTPSYDANGNLTNDGLHAYSWDADGNSANVDSVSITYDALGRAVEQNRGGTYSQIVYSPGGSKLAFMSGQSLQKAFIALPGGATAVYNSSGLAYYRHSDWLGSSRIASMPDRTVYSSQSYAPFGEAYVEAGNIDRSFAGHDEDTVSGIFDAPFRRYSPAQGRWNSPDPAGLLAVDASDPQTWNRYTYVNNDPTGETDEDGLCPKGTHAATADDAKEYMKTVQTYNNPGLTHSAPDHGLYDKNGALKGIDCSGLIMAAVSGKNYNKGKFDFGFTYNGINFTTRNVNSWTDPGTGAFGDVISFPGHVALVLSQSTFIGSQGQGNNPPGPSIREFGTKTSWWGKGTFRRPCIKDSKTKPGASKAAGSNSGFLNWLGGFVTWPIYSENGDGTYNGPPTFWFFIGGGGGAQMHNPN